MTAITRKRGDTKPIQGYARLNGEVLDITGCSFLLTVDPAKAPTTADNNLFSVAGTVVDYLTGELKFPMTALQADIKPGIYYFDIQMTDPEGYTSTLDLDVFRVVQDITKAE